MDPRVNATSAQRELYERIFAYEFDAPGSTFPFSARLARENGWSRGYTARVITEYRRFVFLAVIGRHPVSPSDDVDQAWHLHLLYTKSYWTEFCGAILKRPLHHAPTQGGSTERDKFMSWYRHTLERYRTVFDVPPPADIWPTPEIRFDDANQFQRVNLQRAWMVRKPWARGGSS